MNIKVFEEQASLSLPALRGRIGDWFYYITVLTFDQVEKRVYLPVEIDEYNNDNEKLGDWIQRDLDESRTHQIVGYLKNQPQRFFNSLILGIYGGMPSWQELDIVFPDQGQNNLSEETIEYLGRTFGVLTLNGNERIFAIDGQHRAIGIREAVSENEDLRLEEVSVIFVPHGTNNEGKVRTRRLFSTLNRYAKPVNLSEIIALSEDDNSAVLTRDLIEQYEPFINKILINKTRVISPNNTTHFSNIRLIYDGIHTLLTNKTIFGIPVSGYNAFRFNNQRISDDDLLHLKEELTVMFDEVIGKIPSINNFFISGYVNRSDMSTSLLFRPIGQNILFFVIKVAKNNNLFNQALAFFAKDDFNLNNPAWRTIFWNSDTETLVTEKSRQRFAVFLILENIGLTINRTQKDNEIYQNYGISADDI